MKKKLNIRLIIIAAYFIAAALMLPAQPPVGEFSFLHVSDSHVSYSFEMPQQWDNLRSYACISTIKNLGNVEMPAYKTTAPAPSFIIHTGDVSEFGFAGVTQQIVKEYFKGFKGEFYYVPGNHDNTWVSDMAYMRKKYGGMNYSFDYGGCHFIGLSSATLHDPVPSFGREVILFVQNDLKKVNPQTPVFVFFHHPLDSNEFCSPYDPARLVDCLRGHNIALILDGHGHQAVKHNFWGLDGIEGGSPFAAGKAGTEGFNIVYVKNNELYAAYKLCSETSATKALVQKKIFPSEPYPEIIVRSPSEDLIVGDGYLPLDIEYHAHAAPAVKASFILDDETTGELNIKNSRIHGNVAVGSLCNGVHHMRVNITDASEKKFEKNLQFIVDKPLAPKMGQGKWRFRMNGASKAAPLVHGGVVYAGSNDGFFYAVNAETGELKWSFDAGAEILASAAAWQNLILFGAGDGKFYALTPAKEVKWTYDVGVAIYSSPVVDENGTVYFGTNDARLIALDAASGKPVWTNSDARLCVESQPFVRGDRVYFGAWDGYLYCLNRKDGKMIWKKPGPQNQSRVNTYYAPADNGPAAADAAIYLTDRGYIAGQYALDGSYVKTLDEKCSALALSADGNALYLRRLGEPVKKIKADTGADIWESKVTAGRIPVSPMEKDGVLYVCADSGRLYALDAQSGAVRWEYQVTPKLYVMSGVAVAGDKIVYTTDMDGVITAIEPWREK